MRCGRAVRQREGVYIRSVEQENVPPAEPKGYMGQVGFWRVSVAALVPFGDEGLGAVVCRGVLRIALYH